MISSPNSYARTPRTVSVRPSRLDKVIEYVAPGIGLKRRAHRARLAMTNQYRGAENSRLRADWILGQSDATPGGWELSRLRARSRDLNRNDPVASGATETMGINIVGQGLKPQSRLRAEVIGISPDRAAALRK